MEISFKQTLFSIDPKNKRCVDCGDQNVTYVSINHGITICDLCVPIHQQLGPEISKLHKIEEELDDYSMNFFIYGGNKNFKKTLKNIGVNLDMQRSKLYQTYGVDYYRKLLLSKVNCLENTIKVPSNPNELINSEKNSNLEKNKNLIENDNEEHKLKEDKNSVNNINNFLNINNNLGNKTNVGEDDNEHESHIQLNFPNTGNIINKNKINLVDNKESFRKRSLLRNSIDKVKKFGGYIKKNSNKGIVAIKKAGNIIAQKSKPAAEKIKNTAKYMGDHMPYFHKKNLKSQGDIRVKNNFEDANEDKKNDKEFDDKKNDKEIDDGNQIEF